MSLFNYLNVPSWQEIRRAVTCRNFGRFLTSPLMASFAFFLAGLYANSVLQVVADRQVVHCGEEKCPPLPDLGHDVFPHLTFVRICDYWLYIAVGSTLVRFSPLFVNYSLSLVMLRRWAFLQGMLFWMRGISVALTRQSVPQEDCITTALGNPWIEGFYIMTGMHITCGDIMYSGHTAGITLCVLMWTHYSKGEEWKVCCGDRRPYLTPNLDAVGDPATCSLTAVLAWAFAATGFFFIIATHFHYSNDVFIGLIITQFVFRVYHYYIKTVLELPGWWAKLFRWFEGFDTALLQQIREGKHGETRRGLLNGQHAADDEEAVDAETTAGGGGMRGPAAQAAYNAGHRNEAEAVKPLAGVAVAIFSEGPEKAERAQEEREKKFGKGGLLGSSFDKIKSAAGNDAINRNGHDPASAAGADDAPAARASAASASSYVPAGRVGNGVVSPRDATGEFVYHAFNHDGGDDERSRHQSQRPTREPQTSVVVPGEIARQSPG